MATGGRDFDAYIRVALLCRADSRVGLTVLDTVVATLVDKQRERVLAICLQEVLADGRRAMQAAGLFVKAEREEDRARGLEVILNERLDSRPA